MHMRLCLLFHISTTVAPFPECPRFTEELLLLHAEFICNQVIAFDADAGEEDVKLYNTPCMSRVAEYSGISEVRQKMIIRMIRKSLKNLTEPNKQATTTPMVKHIFEELFHAQIKGGLFKKKRQRCNNCANCRIPDCGTCVHCLDMKKYGGPGIKKQACKQRLWCLNEKDEDEETNQQADPMEITDKKTKKKGK